MGSEQAGTWPNGMIEYEELDRREEGLEMEGRIPSLTHNAGIAVQSRINDVIDHVIASKIADAREMRARTLTFDFDAYFSAPYMSIVLKSTAASASSKTEVVSVNFNTANGETVSAEEVVGAHVVQLADRLLVEMIRRNPERYNPGFAGMRDDQAFSLTNSEIVFWFNEFQLAPGFEGIVPLAMRLRDIREAELSYDEFRVYGGFNLKMIPLPLVLPELGYRLYWNTETARPSVYHNDELIIELIPDVNDYIRESRFASFTRSLEVAPEIRYGRTYVPISFFDQILSLVAYSIDENDNITFASYLVTDDWFDR